MESPECPSSLRGEDALAARRTASWWVLLHLISFWLQGGTWDRWDESTIRTSCVRASLIHGRMWTTFSPSVTQWDSQPFNEVAQKINSKKCTFLSFQLCSSEEETHYGKHKKSGYSVILIMLYLLLPGLRLLMFKLCFLAIIVFSFSPKSLRQLQIKELHCSLQVLKQSRIKDICIRCCVSCTSAFSLLFSP